MAKGKHAAALFEVIHSDRRFGKKTPPSRALATPKWWFKGKSKSNEPVSSVAPDPAAPPAAARAPEPIDFLPAVPSDVDAAAPTPGSVDVKVNPDRQEISFRLTYHGAIVGLFALAVVLSLAYIVGRRMSRGPAPAVAAAASTNEIRRGKPQPGVLDLQTAARGVTSISPAEDESANVIDPAPARQTPSNTAQTPAAPQQPAPVAAGTVNDLVVNKQYVIMQSFPAEEKALADEAARLLREAGIGAVVVKGVPGWPSTWYSVVGTRAFDSTRNNPQYEDYKQSIMNVSAKYAGRSKFKQFDPIVKRWSGVQ